MKKLIFMCMCVVMGLVISLSSQVQAQPGCEDFEFASSDWNHYVYDAELLAKAQPDECFFGIGDANNIWPFASPPLDWGTDCFDCGGQAKVNQAYVWGLAKYGDNVWFGTAPNVHCLVMMFYLQQTASVMTDSYVCEMGESLSGFGDIRPPDFFVYNTVTKTLTKKNLSILMAGPPHSDRAMSTIGIRSAGALDDVVFLAGPGMFGINMFAFNANTGAFLGSATRPEANIRCTWLVVNDVLYIVAADHVLKWTGNVSDPFQFDVVGNLPDQGGANMAFHDGRIFITTWPGSEMSPGGDQAGLWMSPPVDPCLTTADVNDWVKVWKASDYEPDPVVAATYAGGALESFDGWVYWGTMHVPMMATMAHTMVYGEPADEMAYITTALNTHRAISIFRGRNFGTPGEEIQLLYGESSLPAYDPFFGGWLDVPTGHGPGEPLYGASGFDNFFNNYTWTMAVYDDQLFVGTMDWGYLALGDLGSLLGDGMGSGLIELIISLLLPDQCLGADLYRFTSSNAPAVPVSLAGIGNYTNYGIRTMVSSDSLYMGTSNPMNLLTDPYDDKPEGGWELRRLRLCTTELAGDLNGDGVVNMVDFAIFANNWLKECGSCE
jgi:hypothetical protein